MPLYDLICERGHKHYDWYLKLGERPPCTTCGAKTETLWERPPNVIQDSIEGGIDIKHGICWPSGEPRRFYSKKEIARVAKEKGLVNLVQHTTAPDTDKNPFTTRWI